MKKQSARRTLRRTLTLIIAAVVACWFVRARIMDLYAIPSRSMQPFVEPGDRVLAYHLAYGVNLPVFDRMFFGSSVSRGDVIIFDRGNKHFIKRVVGVAGDTVQLRDGQLFLNQLRIKRRPIEPFVTLGAVGMETRLPQYQEVLEPTVSYRIIEEMGDRGGWDDTPRFVVPAGQVFVLGDNRDNSVDSRAEAPTGPFIALEDIVGRVVWVWK